MRNVFGVSLPVVFRGKPHKHSRIQHLAGMILMLFRDGIIQTKQIPSETHQKPLGLSFLNHL